MQIDFDKYDANGLQELLETNAGQRGAEQWRSERKIFEEKLKNTDVFREYSFEEGALNNGLELTLDNSLWVVSFINNGKRLRCAYFSDHGAALRYLFLRVTKRSYHWVRSAGE